MTARHEFHDTTVRKVPVLVLVFSHISLYHVRPALLNQQIWNKQNRTSISKYLSRQSMPSGRQLRLAGRKGKEKRQGARIVVSQVIIHNRVRGCKYQLFLARSWADTEIYYVWETAAANTVPPPQRGATAIYYLYSVLAEMWECRFLLAPYFMLIDTQ